MYDLVNLNLKRKLRELRKENNLTLEDLGNKINKSKSTMYKYESGEVTPDFQTLLLIANIFNIDINNFCNIKSGTTTISRAKNPFETNKLFMYYNGKKSLIVSMIEIEQLTYQKAICYNAIKGSNNKEYRKKYEGALETEKEDAYFTFTSSEKDKLEKIQIQVKIPRKEANIYFGYIASDSSAQKCVITKDFIVQREVLNEIFNELKVTSEEINNIKENQYWNFDISDEKLYRISQKELENLQ